MRTTLRFAVALSVSVLALPSAATTTCSATMTDINFGNVDPTGALVNATATLNYSCTYSGGLLGGLSGSFVRMCFSIGTGTQGASYNPRIMKNANVDPMNFQFYRDAARTQIWGSVDNATYPPRQQDVQFAILGNGTTQTGTITLYGQVPSGQTGLGVGSYTDAFSGVHTKLSYQYNEALLSLGTFPATCGTANNGTFPFTARADVQPRCLLSAASDLDFNSVAGTVTSNVDRQSSITMSCTYRTAWQIALDDGQHTAIGPRRMTGPGSYSLAYELYRDVGRRQRWGNTLNVDTLTGSGTAATQTLTVYGRVPPQAPVAAGAYSDKITVTVTF